MSEVTDEVTGLNGLDDYPHCWFGGLPPKPLTESPSLTSDPAGFAASLAEMSRTLRREGASGPAQALAVVTAGAVVTFAGADQSAVVGPDGIGGLAIHSTRGDLPVAVLSLHNEWGQGPLLDSVTQSSQVLIGDVATETRWPLFVPRAARLGVGSMLCTPLAVQDAHPGSLCLLAARPHAFNDETAALAAVFAAHASIALINSEELRGVRAMAGGRDVIGQAKGILMERFALTADQAFMMLVQASQHTNVKLRDICQRLACTGELPTC